MSDFAKLKGRSRRGSISITVSRVIGTPIDTKYTGVTKMLKRSITPVVATTADANPIIAPLKLFLYLYVSDATREKVALDAKFITNPYQPVSLIVTSSINALTREIIGATIGP